MDTKTISLRKPITVGEAEGAKTFDAIVLREPTAGEYEAAEKVSATYGMAAALVAVVSGVPIDVVDQMFESQLEECDEFLGSFGEKLLYPDAASADEISIALVQPVKLTDDDTPLNISTLTLCEPTNKQRRSAQSAGGPVARGIVLISLIGRVPQKSVRAMCARDYLAAMGYFNGFQKRRRSNPGD